LRTWKQRWTNGTSVRAPPLYELVLAVRAVHADEVVEWLTGRGAPGLEERAVRGGVEVVLYGEDRNALGRLESVARRELSAAFPISVEVRDADANRAAWRSAWAEHLSPQRLTSRLVAVPTTSAVPRLPRTSQAILLEPALAFGFGEHPTTRLAARAVEGSCLGRKAIRVLDVGSGSGILSFTALLSGARRALGVDIDPAAVGSAQRNAALNRLAGRCRFVTTPVAKLRGKYDLAVANIRLAPLLDLAPALAGVVRPGGKLFLSGVLVSERRELELRYLEVGFRGLSVRTRRTEQGWALVALRRVP
jgi:ribosomal protein L11 methyltransferase